jgi:RHS repeat-associated protein
MMKNHNFYGHPTRIIKKSWNGSTLDLTDSTELSILNNTANDNWFIGQISRQSVSKIRDETETVITNNYYNSGTGAPYLTYIHKDETNEVKKNYTYDIFGNIENITISALNDPTIHSSNRIKTTMNLYSSTGRFPESTINPLGFESSYLFDGVSGLIVSKTDEENNLTESYEYDGLGRKQRTIKKEGTEILTTLHWASGHADAPTGATVFKLIQKSGMADEYIFSDKHGRELRSVTNNFDGEKIYIDKLYNSKSQLWKESLPYSPGTTVHYTEYTYDNYGRISQIDYPDGRFEGYYYGQNYTRIKSGKGPNYRYSYKYTNSLGEIIRMRDSESKNVYTHFYPNGLPKSYDYGNGYKVELEYDINGNRTMISDPNAGSIISAYNAWGELLSQTDYRGNSTEFKYDILSRLVEEKQSSSVGLINTKTFTYDPAQYTGVLEKVSQTHRKSEMTYDYDHFGRITKETEIYYTDDAETQFMTVGFEKEYDELGRVDKRIYPSGFEVDYSYNEFGDLKSMNALGITIWQCEEVNDLGQIFEYSMGNSATQIGYNSYGELQSMDLSSKLLLSYSFDDFGNMASRGKPVQYFNETFEYDNMNRLKEAELKIDHNPYPGNDFSIEYDNNGFGNMVSKSDVGDFRYVDTIGGVTAGPHAFTRIDNLVDYMPPNQNITYTCFNKVATIEENLPNDDVQHLEIIYGVDDQRRQSVYTLNENEIKTKYFFGDYEEIEEDGITMAYHFIHSPNGLCAVYEAEKDAITDSIPSILWHINTDHLGSIAYMEDASNSSNIKEYSFTAWGLSRDPDAWAELNTQPLYADRGFTGHEHLSEFNLINMNGRVYDPITARFLSPDPYIQMPGMRSGFNRYSYCLNNPLVYTDPSGEFIFSFFLPGVGTLIDAACWGAVIGGYSGYQIGQAAGAEGIQLVGYIAGGAIIGAGAGAAGVALGTAAAAGTTGLEAAVTSGFIGGMTSGAINGGGMTALSGGSGHDIIGGIVQGAVVGGISGMAGGATFQATNDLLMNAPNWIPNNTISYLSGSTASRATANLLTGSSFEGFGRDLFLDPGLLIPATMDVVSIIPPLFNNVIDRKISETGNKNDLEIELNPFKTHTDENGNLMTEPNYNISFTSSEKTISAFGGLFQNTIPGKSQSYHIEGIPYLQLFSNYRSLVFSLYNTRLYR